MYSIVAGSSNTLGNVHCHPGCVAVLDSEIEYGSTSRWSKFSILFTSSKRDIPSCTPLGSDWLEGKFRSLVFTVLNSHRSSIQENVGGQLAKQTTQCRHHHIHRHVENGTGSWCLEFIPGLSRFRLPGAFERAGQSIFT